MFEFFPKQKLLPITAGKKMVRSYRLWWKDKITGLSHV